VVDLGAWPVPVKVQVMELQHPGHPRRGRQPPLLRRPLAEFSIYDVDFVPIPTVDPQVPATAGLHWFGVVQYIGLDRIADWTAFYGELFGFTALPDEQRSASCRPGASWPHPAAASSCS
jgi:4-hydroxyphenylpyruvate dioxygenase